MPDGATPSLTQPKSGSSPALTACFLLLSLLLSLACVSTRNTYDDEYSNLNYVALSVPQIIHTANSVDVHPPGMYLLTHFAYELIPSPRWMTLFDLVFLYAGLTTFLFALTPLFPTLGTRVCFLLLACLHPQLLMWGITIRWYGWWTGIALVTLVVALRPGAGLRPALGWGRAVIVGLLLSCLFYLNYITLVFGLALGVCLLFRYSWQAWKQYLVILAVFIPLIYPQLHAFLTVHIPGGGGQRTSLALSLARLVEGLLCSEAYLPWHPLALLALVIFAAIIVAGLVRSYRRARTTHISAALLTEDQGLASIILFAVCFFCLVVAAGFGLKPRNGLLLVPVLAVPFALIVGALQSSRLQALVLVCLALWSGVGISHLVRRNGLSKSNMNNRPEELTTYMRSRQSADCSVVVTYDTVMSLAVSMNHLPRTLVLSPEHSAYPLQEPRFPLAQCSAIDLYRVKSYLGGLGSWGEMVSHEVEAADPVSLQPAQILRLSLDPDAPRKRKLTFMSGASELPDYRYVVTVERITPAEFERIEREMLHFAPSDGQPKPTLDTPIPPRPS